MDASYGWSGNHTAGAGSMRIVEAAPSVRVRIDLRFDKPFKARNDTVFTIDDDAGGCVVTWTMTGRRTLAVKAMGLFTSMDSFLGRDFEKGLARLKAVAEGPPST